MAKDKKVKKSKTKNEDTPLSPNRIYMLKPGGNLVDTYPSGFQGIIAGLIHHGVSVKPGKKKKEAFTLVYQKQRSVSFELFDEMTGVAEGGTHGRLVSISK